MIIFQDEMQNLAKVLHFLKNHMVILKRLI
jgi:hypothetical protein